MVIIPIPIPKYVVQLVPASGRVGWVGAGVGATAIKVDLGVGADVTVGVDVGAEVIEGHVQSDSFTQLEFLQLPDAAPDAILHIRSDGQVELFVQLLLHCGT